MLRRAEPRGAALSPSAMPASCCPGLADALRRGASPRRAGLSWRGSASRGRAAGGRRDGALGRQGPGAPGRRVSLNTDLRNVVSAI